MYVYIFRRLTDVQCYSLMMMKVMFGYHADLSADSLSVSDVGTRHLTETNQTKFETNKTINKQTNKQNTGIDNKNRM